MIREGVSHRRGQRHVVYVVCYLKLGVGCHVRYVCMSRHCFRHCFSMRGRRVGCSELLFCGKGKGEIKKVFVDAKVYIVGWFGLRFPANLRAKRSADEPGGASARDPEAHVSGVTEDLANQNQSKFGQREQRRAEAWREKRVSRLSKRFQTRHPFRSSPTQGPPPSLL